MKPSERIKEIQEKNRMTGKYWSLELAIFDYLDEEHEKKQFKNQNVIENNTFYQINDTPKS